MKTWQIIGLVVLGGLAAGYLLAKSAPNVAYKSEGTPIGPSLGTDPTASFIANGPVS